MWSGLFLRYTFRVTGIAAYLEDTGIRELSQTILMTIYRTFQRRCLHSLEVLSDTMRSYVSTDSIPPLLDSASIC